jgi:hypothetical protein
MTREQSESKIQSECVRWLWNNLPATRGLFFEINNNPTDKRDGAIRRAAGMVAGVADTCFLWAGRAYFIEFKTLTGRHSKPQGVWADTVNKQGFDYHTVRSLYEFQVLINQILIEKRNLN